MRWENVNKLFLENSKHKGAGKNKLSHSGMLSKYDEITILSA